MSAQRFDPIAFVRRMESVGFTRQQAIAMAEEHIRVIEYREANRVALEQLRGPPPTGSTAPSPPASQSSSSHDPSPNSPPTPPVAEGAKPAQ